MFRSPGSCCKGRRRKGEAMGSVKFKIDPFEQNRSSYRDSTRHVWRHPEKTKYNPIQNKAENEVKRKIIVTAKFQRNTLSISSQNLWEKGKGLEPSPRQLNPKNLELCIMCSPQNAYNANCKQMGMNTLKSDR